ncbi:MAG TPA: Hsp20/alpha crystallin family protein [Thermoanaerobaculia bacterium]|jgi:HSP20 family protein|nr:Hsp20/alpha crystallin family protein [Thermoanaerobaculia bacterium]
MRTALTRWTPAGDLVRDRVGRLFEEAFNDMLRPFGADAEGVASRAWLPPVDIREDADGLWLVTDLPGFRKEDVNISLENGVLTIAGERKLENEEKKNETYHRLERAYGNFSRSFTLAPTVRTDKVEATFQDGVLTIHLPKQEESKPRRIAIT